MARTKPGRGTPPGKASDMASDKAGHGYRNEVNWRSGAGRQPYPNQEPSVPDDPAAAGEHAEGDRGVHSGVTLEQMRQARQKP